MSELFFLSENEEEVRQDSEEYFSQQMRSQRIKSQERLELVPGIKQDIQKKQKKGKQEGENRIGKRENQKMIKEKKQAEKRDANINKLDQLEKSYELFSNNGDNQFENHGSNDNLYEKEKAQRRHDSKSKLKTQTKVQFTDQFEVDKSCQPPQVVNKEPEHQIQQNKKKRRQQKTELRFLNEFVGRKFVEFQKKETDIKKNIEKHYLNQYFKFLCILSVKYGEGYQNIRGKLDEMLEKKSNDWDCAICTNFCIRDNYRQEIKEKKFKQKLKEEIQEKIKKKIDNLVYQIKKTEGLLEYIEDKKKVKLNCQDIQRLIQIGPLKSQPLNEIKEKIKQKEEKNQTQYNSLMLYFEIVDELKGIGGIKKTINIKVQDIKKLHEDGDADMKQFLNDIIKKIISKEPDEPTFQELKTMFDNQEIYLKKFQECLENFYQNHELCTEIKKLTVTKSLILQKEEKKQKKQEKKLNQKCQKQEQMSLNQ